MKAKKQPCLALVTGLSPKASKSTTNSQSKKSAASSPNSERNPIAEVYRYFHIDPLEVAAAPEVSGIMAEALGGTVTAMPMPRIMHLLASSDSKAARQFIRECDLISGKEGYDRLSIEALCVYAKVSPFKILDAVAKTEKRLRLNEKSLRSSTQEADDAQMEMADEAFDQCFPPISERLEIWGEWRREMMDARLNLVP